MALHPGRTVGPYTVIDSLGAGGMGEVYRARDVKLQRDVAIKILRDDFATDPDRLARFEREAQALAALNHPGIAQVFAVLDQPLGIIMELVDGEDLSARLRRGPFPAEEALAIATQIAAALEAAHDRGIVHRDLKPANIKVRPDGTVKVLDFGLAKAMVRGVDIGELSTLTSPAMTADGIILGTAAYMSPEQARGLPVDRRTDLWAFGCVLYEMLTGRRPFAGDTVSDLIASVLARTPDLAALPAATPPEVRRLIRRCLEKNPQDRIRDAGDVRLELEDALAAQPELQPQHPAPARSGRWRPLAIGAGLTSIVALLAVLLAPGDEGRDDSVAGVTRTTVMLPPGHELDTGDGAGPLAISPDGRSLAYVTSSGGRTQLHLRSLDSFDARAIPETEGAQHPFFSPDGESVGVFVGRKLKRVSTRGGLPTAIGDVPSVGRGGTWAADGTIVFASADGGLMQISAAGGTAAPLTSRETAIAAGRLAWPEFLPGGRVLLATIPGDDPQPSALVVLSRDTGEWRRLGVGSQARYLPSGHLLYHADSVREGELHAVRFDPATLAIGGTPVTVMNDVFRAQNGGAAFFAVAQNGTLVFTGGGYARRLVRVDRNGRRTPLLDERRGFRHPNVSPDGRHVALTVDPRPSQIWVYDLARRAGIPLATENHNLSVAWSADGRRVTYTSRGDMFWRDADASGPPERLLARERAQYATSWARDGTRLFFNDTSISTGVDIWVLPRGGDPHAVLATPANEGDAQLSADGRWLAYRSDESGRVEVYVRPFPDVMRGKWTISTAGGEQPKWSSTGRELFYAAGSALMRVPIEIRHGQFSAGSPELLFDGPFDTAYTRFAVLPDGTGFVMVEVDPHARPTQIQVVVNWIEDLKRREAGAGAAR